MNDRCAFILHAYTRPEKSAEFEALFAGYVDASRAEEGCLEYHMLRDAQDPTLFIFFELGGGEALLQFDAQRLRLIAKQQGANASVAGGQ